MELQGRYASLKRQGIGLAAFSYDSRAVLAAFARERRITFPLISDGGSAIIRRYGLLNTTVAADHRFFGIPFPGTLVVDGAGHVVARHFEEEYSVRSSAAAIEAKLGLAVDTPRQQVDVPYMTIATQQTDATAVPGTKLTLMLSITPDPGVHVYAPGQTSYRQLRLTVAPHPLVRLAPILYPPAEDYLFKPLNERTKVYTRPIQLLQDVTIVPGEAAMALANTSHPIVTIKATLDYQACDEQICYVPESVQLTWTVGLRPLGQ